MRAFLRIEGDRDGGFIRRERDEESFANDEIGRWRRSNGVYWGGDRLKKIKGFVLMGFNE